jgi:hypothetical protein
MGSLQVEERQREEEVAEEVAAESRHVALLRQLANERQLAEECQLAEAHKLATEMRLLAEEELAKKAVAQVEAEAVGAVGAEAATERCQLSSVGPQAAPEAAAGAPPVIADVSPPVIADKAPPVATPPVIAEQAPPVIAPPVISGGRQVAIEEEEASEESEEESEKEGEAEEEVEEEVEVEVEVDRKEVQATLAEWEERSVKQDERRAELGQYMHRLQSQKDDEGAVLLPEDFTALVNELFRNKVVKMFPQWAQMFPKCGPKVPMS